MEKIINKKETHMTFKELNLSNEMNSALEAMGFKEASEIQEKAIPIVLEGKDIIGQAKTGTGKTASFAIPIIEKTIVGGGMQHVVLAPSRELAKQIHEEVIKLGSVKGVRAANIIGGVSYDIQKRDILRNPEVLIATPGRLIDHLESKRIPLDLTNVQTLTLDEADEMLNFGFYKEMLKINKFLPEKKQTLLFTATFNKKTKDLAKDLLVNPVQLAVSSGLSTNERVEQSFVILREKSKLVTLFNLLQLHAHESVIIFGRTKRRVDELSEALVKLGFKAKGIQGDMRQNERSRAMSKFRNGSTKILIGTDVLARGIDVDTVDLIFNFDLPTEVEYYTHRIGRTGRAGRKGKAISFVKEQEQFYFEKILEKTQSKAKQVSAPSDTDMAEVKAEQLDVQLSKLLAEGRDKYRGIASRIAEEYTPEHLGLIVAAATIGERSNPYEIKLTGESGIDTKNKRRSGGRRSSGGGSRGGSRGGSSRGGSSRGGSRGGSSRSGGQSRSSNGNYSRRSPSSAKGRK